MEPLQLLLFIILCSIVLLLIYFIWKVKNMPKPKPGKSCLGTAWKWDESCQYFQELTYDPTLTSPKGTSPYLIGFSYSGGVGNPVYLPRWYRFRYVNVLTGGFSDFSDWSASPVISGSCCMPCPDGVGKCSSEVPLGSATCPYNRPTIGISQDSSSYNPLTPQKDGSFIYINVHRYVGSSYDDITPPTSSAKDEIIGYMIPNFTYGGETYYGYIDVMDDPCKTSTNITGGGTSTPPKCTTPSWCSNSNNGTCAPDACSAI